MFWTVLNHQVRRLAVSNPVIFTSTQHQSILNTIKGSTNSYSRLSHLNPRSSSSSLPNFHGPQVEKYRSENPLLSLSSLHRKYSVLHKNFNSMTTYPSNFSLSPAACSNLFSSSQNNRIFHQNHKTKLFVPSPLTGSLNVVREDHHLSQRGRYPPTLAHNSHGSRTGLPITPGGNIQQSRAINIPKMILDASPTLWHPYLQLIRFDKPIGTWLLYWPCTWSIALAAQPGCLPDFYMLALFGAGAFFMRGAGCIVNDMWDKDFDIKVERTRERPLACDKITYPQALTFLATQLGISLAILLQLNWYSIGLGVASMSLVVTYPTFKRFTYWPQIVLGFAFNYGALLGWAAVRGSCDWSICIPMYFMCHMWTMIYDTIYAHQDKSDDILVGVKSTALRFGPETKLWLSGFTTMMASGLFYVGHLTNMTWPYYTGASITIASILMQLYRLDIDNPEACGDAFRFHFYIGLLMFVSIMFGNLAKPKEQEVEAKEFTYDVQS